jgi:hypothetical protein
MKSIEDLKLVRVSEENKKWVRDIYFTYEGEEQFVELAWEEDCSYEILDSEFTAKFREALDAWHDTTDELFESMLDDLTWVEAGKRN